MKLRPATILFGYALVFLGYARAADDLLIADFESAAYGSWSAQGNAFGTAPAHGTLPGQMPVTGFQGNGLVNSFLGGDRSTGTLTSPEFKIERPFIKFLIGGGGFEGKTCMNLVVEGKGVRTATGPNTQPGGSEHLESGSWNVEEFVGKTARIEIVDAATGGWGHINVDQIIQTDRKPAALITNAARELTAAKQLLNFPVKNGAKKRKVSVLVDGRAERFFEIELADAEPDWWAPLDISACQGRKLTVQVDKLSEDSGALAQIEQSDTLKGGENLYREPLRAQLHFSPKRGWLNDPNGMVWSQGEYHLYFQHNPYGWNWGNMHWGHAVSRDLVYWEELPIAIYPAGPNDAAFSGSAVVDKQNTSGWKKGSGDLLVAAYTSTGRGECIVYSNDKGRSWSEYDGNPVIKHEGRDPRLLWHEPTRQWVMALYDEDKTQAAKDQEQCIVFYTSPDLKKWSYQSRIRGFFECPDIFELPVDGNPSNKKWVLTAANSDYMVGTFDGKTFTPETPKLKGHRGRGFYAAQTFTNEPKGRTVQIGWFQVATPGMPFNQAMSLPLELSLQSTPEGPRLSWKPVTELEQLRSKSSSTRDFTLKPGDANPLANTRGELVELRASFEPGQAKEVQFNVRGVPIVYDPAKQELRVKDHIASAPLRDGKQQLIVYADRAGFEIFTSNGLTYVPMPIIPDPNAQAIEVTTTGGEVRFNSLEAHELQSTWKSAP
ncbi:glycoside hydrolase family 32 protein [Verrucomicrobiota bacterium sgz303538]